MEFAAYELDEGIYDEMLQSNGEPREHSRLLYETLCQLTSEEIGSIQERVTRSFSNEGISFTVYGDEEGDERIIPVDCVPRMLPAPSGGSSTSV